MLICICTHHVLYVYVYNMCICLSLLINIQGIVFLNAYTYSIQYTCVYVLCIVGFIVEFHSCT